MWKSTPPYCTPELHSKLKFPANKMYNISKLPDIVIPNGGTDSPVFFSGEVYGDAYDLGFISGATTGDIQVSNDGVNFTKLSGLTANSAEVVSSIPFAFMRIHLAVAAVGDVIVKWSKRWHI